MLLPHEGPPSVHNLQNKKWWRDTRMHLCEYAAHMWIPPIKQ